MTTTLPEVTLEDKKLIATEVLGKEWHHGSLWVDGYRDCEIEYFHPSGLHFYEVIGKLDDATNTDINDFIFRAVSMSREFVDIDNPLDSYRWIESHKEEIIQNLIVIIKEGKA